MQTAPSAPTTATTAPAPGLGRRSPAHGRTAPSSAGQGSQKAQHQDGADARRGETVRGGRSSQGWPAPRTISASHISAVDRATTAGFTHSIFSHSGETSGQTTAQSFVVIVLSYSKESFPHCDLLTFCSRGPHLKPLCLCLKVGD